MTLILQLWQWFVGLFQRAPRPFAAVPCDDPPERLKIRTLYLSGDAKQPWKATLVCPCGCGETIDLNLAPPGRPRWSVINERDGSVTLDPSVWRSRGCRSHFWLRRGQIVWCPPDKPAGG